MAESGLCPDLSPSFIESKIMRLLSVITAIILYALPVFADSPSLESLYINPKEKNRSTALIIYNTANPCENCPKAQTMILQLLKQKYANILDIYEINLNTAPEFSDAFNITAPLTLVIIRISDNAAFGYEKLEGLQSAIYDKEEFNRRIESFINNFLS